VPPRTQREERSSTRLPDGELDHLRRRIAELERLNEELDRFAAAVAHELREPLISVEGYAGLLTERLAGALDDFAREDLEALVRGTTRMRLLIDTLLRHARRGGRPPLRARVDLTRVARDCIAILQPEIAAHGARITVDPLPVVKGDAPLLSSVLQNLLVNALNYGPRESGMIRLSASREHDRWKISVVNAGRPFLPADRSRIFSPFRRGRSERRADGIGLGLALCRTIVEEHGGDIGVEPLRAGNRFFFTLVD
jgi:light-regulated signal transduction histidine kinase (bacteriophytochrome)